MYTLMLAIHSWIRWAVLLFGMIAIARAIAGRSGRPWTSADDRAGMLFITALDLQVLVGLLLYFALSPITLQGLRDMGGAMSNAGLRFWAVEHPVQMILGVVLAHIGRARTRRTADDVKRHRAALIFFTLAVLVILLAIPWPGREMGRPLFRF
jgi:hypothetical protein